MLFTRKGLFVVVAFCLERSFHPTKTGISSYLFKSSENIALEGRLDGQITARTRPGDDQRMARAGREMALPEPLAGPPRWVCASG